MNKGLILPLAAALLLLNGCNKNKELLDTIADLKARVEKLEQIVMGGGKDEPAGQQAAYDVPVGDSAMLGDKDAKLSIVVFSNFQCPYCARADKALRALVNDKSLKMPVNVVFKHFPFERHPEARPASKAAMAAGEQGKFWEMADKIFANQNDMNEKNYEKWAKELSLDVEKFKKDLKANDAKYNEIIDRDIKLGAENAKLEGTPWILLNGWLLEGEINAATINKMIEDKKLGS